MSACESAPKVVTQTEAIPCEPPASYTRERSTSEVELEPADTQAAAARNATNVWFLLEGVIHQLNRLVEYVQQECQ